MDTKKILSVVIPAHNEEGTIGAVLTGLEELEIPLEVIVVDDGSSDRTAEIATSWGRAEVLALGHNRGKGAAVRAGIAASTGEFVLIQDADLEYDPQDIPRLMAPLLNGVADAVFGTRFRGGGNPQRAHMFWHYLGNKLLTLATNVLYNTTISDMEVGYKAFRGDLLRSFNLTSETFTFEPEVTAKTIRSGARVYEVPIAYYGRTYAEGKKITYRDGFLALAALARFRFGPIYSR